MSTDKRFSRFLLDGGFWFDDYVKPVWSIQDKENNDSIVGYLEFKDEYKDICDGLVDLLNELAEDNNRMDKYINKIEESYRNSHGMSLRNADWL